jgi:hypothetical protein
MSEALQADAVSTQMTAAGREKTQTLHRLFTQLESLSDLHDNLTMLEAQGLVIEIVKEIRELTLAIDLKAILEKSTLQPSSKESLPEAARKVGRYYAAASDLISAAKGPTGRVFSKVNVEPFQIQVPPLIKEFNGDLRSWSLPDSIIHLSEPQGMQLKDKLRKRLAEIAMHRKVHAEIQLLFFYELHPDMPRPRFICSHKKACYLCDLFVRVHGGFNVPRCHGRIYDMWILPDWLNIPVHRHRDLADITKRFKEALDVKIEDTLKSGPKNYPDPRESDVPSEARFSKTELPVLLTQGFQASRNTLRPGTSPSQEVLSRIRTARSETFPSVLTGALRNPSDASSNHSHAENMTGFDTAYKPEDCRTEKPPSLNHVSSITVRQKHLPYNKLIMPATPSLSIRVGKFFATLEFAEALSGHLYITTKREWEPNKSVRIVDISDIPTKSEMEVNCFRESNEVQVLLQSQGAEIIYIRFVWEGPH